MQVVYVEKSPACLSKVPFHPDWHITFTPNHWCNEETMMGYLHCILLLYMEKVCSDQKLSSTHPTLLIFDHFKGQTTDRILQALEHNNIHAMEVPTNCTNRLQPLDLSINKMLGSHTKNSLKQWHAVQVQRSFDESANSIQLVCLLLSVLKRLGFQ